MFKRNFEVKLTKPSKEEILDNIVNQELLNTAIIQETVREVARGIALVFGTYIAADTLRRLAIHTVATFIK